MFCLSGTHNDSAWKQWSFSSWFNIDKTPALSAEQFYVYTTGCWPPVIPRQARRMALPLVQLPTTTGKIIAGPSCLLHQMGDIPILLPCLLICIQLWFSSIQMQLMVLNSLSYQKSQTAKNINVILKNWLLYTNLKE